MKGVFVAGTDTGVGKTVVSCLLAEYFRRKKAVVGVMKPYMAGGWSDARKLKASARVKVPLSEISPVYFQKPLAPVVKFGTADSKDPADFSKALACFHRWKKRSDVLVVEGVGGALCPLQGNFTAADMAARLGLPAWIVARPGLGTLNHVLLTVESLLRRKILVQAVVISGYTGRTPAEKTNPDILRRLTGLPVLTFGKIKSKKSRSENLKALGDLFERLNP